MLLNLCPFLSKTSLGKRKPSEVKQESEPEDELDDEREMKLFWYASDSVHKKSSCFFILTFILYNAEVPGYPDEVQRCQTQGAG
jgi:hypothetical protein